MKDKVSVQIIIEGRVHGVGFRLFTKTNALRFNLTGWVKNTVDGNVEAYAEGTKDDIENWLATLFQGPPASFVTIIHKKWGSVERLMEGFHILSTY
jgi:acylphosphatase